MIEASARADQDGTRDLDVGLAEHAGRPVIEIPLRHVLAAVVLALERGADDKHVRSARRTDRALEKRRLMPVALDDFSEFVAMVLIRQRGARRPEVFATEQRLSDETPVDTLRVECLDVWHARCRQHDVRARAAASILSRVSNRRKERTASTVVPEQARPDDGA